MKDNVTDKNELRQALEESVKSHLMSDVPYGVLLSGRS
ncbi:asparagine synthetase B [Klebsiella pneumoniae]|uniref:Asparagine synthetase B n=1 Tax=Klebsiella pneumoniae TaxID=573 RepID=A0A3S4GSV7_KLEPN|nr:asparagine synthetase B [Klebsiella pneumoniae]